MVFKPKYSQEIFDFIREHPALTGRKLCDAIKDKFGVEIPKRSIYNLHKHHALGQKYAHGKIIPSWHTKPIGTERKDKDGYILVRVEGGEKRKHFIEWEKYHEPTKTDEVLIFLDGNKENCDISNLYLMKRKYMGAVNNILKDLEPTPETRVAAINAAILVVMAREKEIQLNKNKPIHKPKTDNWKMIVANYLAGMTTAENAEATGKDKNVIRWTIRRYNLGVYGGNQ